MSLACCYKVSKVLVEVLHINVHLIVNIGSVVVVGASSKSLPSGRTAGLHVENNAVGITDYLHLGSFQGVRRSQERLNIRSIL